MFCPKCKSILVPKKKGNKIQLCCSYCGQFAPDAKAVLSEKVKHDPRKMDVVVKDIEPMSITDATCSKCKHEKAYYWFIQTRASDEAATQFLKCVKCKHQWRVYD